MYCYTSQIQFKDKEINLKPGEIISYREMCNAEKVEVLQRGMNYRLHSNYSVLLMSTRSNAPYEDEVKENGKVLIYEGHDIPISTDVQNPKLLDQPMYTKTGKLTQNGLFYEAAKSFKKGNRLPELVQVYEKIKAGVWVFNGQFELRDGWLDGSKHRIVFKFRLQARDNMQIIDELSGQSVEIEHNRLIPSSVKVEVWKRDKGRCVKCNSNTNLHFDHIIPYSRGGTSLSLKNIQILCMSCNLAKSDKIE